MSDELNLIDIMTSWLNDKFPEIETINDEKLGYVRLRIEPVVGPNPYTGLIGFMNGLPDHNEVGLWDKGRYIFYDPRDPKFFQQIYEHLVRIVEFSKKGENYGH
jgi:hypothetical protein